MLNNFKKLGFIAALTLAPLFAHAEVPMQFLPNTTHPQTVATSKLLAIAKSAINTQDSSLFEIKVQPIYSENNTLDHLLVYSLSGKTYSFKVTKIQLNAAYQKTAVIDNYRLSAQDLAQQPGVGNFEEIKCPDPAVDFVSATPVPSIPTANAAVKNVAVEAKAYSYHSLTLLGSKANVINYLNYLSCPKLKGFFNVGHGSENGIMLYDGLLTSTALKNKLEGKLAEHAVVLFNSCEVFNDPLKSSVIENADAQKYIGGITTLYIGPSELASQCLWNSAFSEQDMTPAMSYCNEHFDKEDQFGIDGKGKDVLNLPA